MFQWMISEALIILFGMGKKLFIRSYCYIMYKKALFYAEDSGGKKKSGKWNFTLGVIWSEDVVGSGDNYLAIAYFK